MKASGLRLFCPLPVAAFRFRSYLRWLECATSKAVADSWERTNALSANCVQNPVLPMPHGPHAGSPNRRICAPGVSSLEPSTSPSSGLLEGVRTNVGLSPRFHRPSFLHGVRVPPWRMRIHLHVGDRPRRLVSPVLSSGGRKVISQSLSASHTLQPPPFSTCACRKAVVGKPPTSKLRTVDGCAEWRWGRYARPPTS